MVFAKPRRSPSSEDGPGRWRGGTAVSGDVVRPHFSSFRRRFSARQHVVGSFIKTPTTHATEIFGALGYDFVVIDEEHAPIDRAMTDVMLLAARASNLAGIVRVSSMTPRTRRSRSPMTRRSDWRASCSPGTLTALVLSPTASAQGASISTVRLSTVACPLAATSSPAMGVSSAFLDLKSISR